MEDWTSVCLKLGTPTVGFPLSPISASVRASFTLCSEVPWRGLEGGWARTTAAQAHTSSTPQHGENLSSSTEKKSQSKIQIVLFWVMQPSWITGMGFVIMRKGKEGWAKNEN